MVRHRLFQEKYIKHLESLTTTCSPTARAHSYITSGSVVQHDLSELMCFDCNAAIRLCGGRVRDVPLARKKRPRPSGEEYVYGDCRTMRFEVEAMASVRAGATDEQRSHIDSFRSTCTTDPVNASLLRYTATSRRKIGPGGPRGRHQWESSDGACGRLTALASDVRHGLLAARYHELDLSKSHMRLLQCCARRHGTVCTAIDAFLSKPKEVLANLGGATPKSRLNALLTSPNPSLHGIDSGGIAWARRFIAERPAVVNALRAHPLCAGHLSESHITLCQHMEDECLLTAIAALREASWEVGITINDSMYVAREPRPVVEAVELAQQTIATAHGLDVQFRVVF